MLTISGDCSVRRRFRENLSWTDIFLSGQGRLFGRRRPGKGMEKDEMGWESKGGKTMAARGIFNTTDGLARREDT